MPPNERSSLLSSPPKNADNSGCALITLFVFCSLIIAAFTGIPSLITSPISSPILKGPLYERDKARQQAGVIWSMPVEGPCLRYGSRSDSARLLNYPIDGQPIDKYWEEACERTPLIVQGKKIQKTCELIGSTVIGHWESNDVGSGCRPYWGPIESEYCSGSDKIISARLMHVKNDMQWKVMCQTTPLHIYGMTKFVMSCENKGDDGIWGYLALKDENCMAEERKKRREEAGVAWSIPQPGPCVKYAVQEHSAPLLHYEVDEYWKEACETTELIFNDQRYESPAKCELLGSVYNKPQVIGYWHVTDQSPECTPYWGSVSNEHCVGTHKRMVSARLWNLQDSKQWYLMCSTAPLTLQGISRLPLSCENKGPWGVFGVWGHWEIFDESCEVLK